MRVNVYNEELTDEVEVVTVNPAPDRSYIGVRVMLKSSEALHHSAGDDDRSAVTFWLGTPEKAIAYFENILSTLRRVEIVESPLVEDSPILTMRP